MLTKFMTRFKPEEAAQLEETQKQQMKKKKKLNNQKRNKSSGTTKASSQEAEDGGRRSSQTCNMDVIGLRIVTQITNSHTKPDNVVVKSAILRKEKYSTNDNTTTAATAGSTSLDSCFLKTCNLCNKKLSHDKDIYMYRGDQGFCSIECRNRQIVMDEMKEAEAFRNHYYKESVSLSSSSYRNCWNDARRETHLILEDLRLHRLQSKPIPNSAHHRQDHWAIVS